LPEYIYPQNVEEVISHLKPSSLLYAGGTGLYKRNLQRFDCIVDLQSLNCQNIIKSRDYLIFDAMVTMAHIIEHPEVPDTLKDICLEIGSTPLRNLITVGGELGQCPYWANLPVYLYATNALIDYYDHQFEKHTIRCRTFFENFSRYKNIFIFRVQIPTAMLDYHSISYNFKETSFDYSIFNYLLLQNPQDKKQTSITIGAVRRFPFSLSSLEQHIQEKGTITARQVKESCQELTSAMRRDIRYSKSYRCEHLQNQLCEDLNELGVLE